MGSEKPPKSSLLKNGRKRSILGLLLLCIALLGGGLLRGVQAGAKGRLECDEGISFTVATGHQAEYQKILTERSHPYGAWVPAKEWKRLFSIEEPFCFRQIGTGLAQHDIHPPFYFWLLHLFIMVFGVHVWTGPALNTLIASGTIIILFLLGRYATRDALAGGAAAFIWAFSPTVILASNEARQYDCLGFCTALLAWQVVRCLDTERRRGWTSLALLGGATTIGLLTYYHIILFLVGCGILFAAYLLKKHRRRFLACCAAMAVGVLLFALLHPRFLESVYLGQARMQSSWGLDHFPSRAHDVLTRYASFVVDTGLHREGMRMLLEYLVLGAFLSLAAAALVVYVKGSLRGNGRCKIVEQRAVQILFLFWWAAGLNVLLFLLGMSPSHAMEPKYPSMVYPLMSVAIVLMLRTFPRARAALMLLLCCALLGSSRYSVFRRRAAEDKRLPLSQVMHQADALVIDNPSVLFLPALTVQLPDQTPMFVAEPADLLREMSKWPDGLGRDSLFVSWTTDVKGAKKADGILALLTKEFEESVIARRLVGWRGVLVRLVRKFASPSASHNEKSPPQP